MHPCPSKMRFGRAAPAAAALCAALILAATPNASASPAETVLHSFGSFPGGSDGYDPEAGLIFDGAGNLYGTTARSGAYVGAPVGYGVVFKLAPPATGTTTWTETVLHAFNFSDGIYPEAGLMGCQHYF